MLNLDFLRFVAAIGVVAVHYGPGLAGLPGFETISKRLGGLSLFVDLFFIISRYVIAFVYAKKMTDGAAYFSFLVRRVARLVPLHWATLLFFVAVGAAAGEHAKYPQMFDMSCFLPNVFLLHSLNTCASDTFNFASWSISAEMVMYLSFPLLLVVGSKAPKLLIGMVAIMLSVLFWTSGGFPTESSHPWFTRTYDWGVLRAIPAFSFGLALFYLSPGLQRLPAPGLIMSVCLIGFVGGCIAGIPASFMVPLIYLVAIMGVAADTQRDVSTPVRVIAPMGQLTYSIYMLHLPMQTFFVSFLGVKMLHFDDRQIGWWTIFSVFVLILVSYLSLVLYETPARRFISRLGSAGPLKATRQTTVP